MKRNTSLDYIRAVAIIMIVTAHFFIFSGAPSYAQCLARIGNFLFFAVSAFLFGIRYECYGEEAFKPVSFLKKRLVRLFASLWPFLIIVLTIYFCIGVDVPLFNAGLNFVGLNWFAKLPNLGHLWFITMIIFCYLMYIGITQSNFSKQSIANRIVGGGNSLVQLLVLFVACFLHVIADSYGLPGTLFAVLAYSLIIFLNAPKILDWCCHLRKKMLWLSFVCVNTIAFITYAFNDYSLSGSVQRFVCYIAGMVWFIFLLNTLNNRTNISRGFLFLSTTSYEIFLVHHVLCVGQLSLIGFTGISVFDYCILWIVSCVLAFLLKKVGDKVFNYCTKNI